LYANLQFYSDLEEEKLLSTLILQKPTPTTIFNHVKKKKDSFFELEIPLPSPLDTHKKQPLLSFLSLLSTKKVFSSGKSRLHDMFRCHSYIWLFIKVAISQNVFEWLCFTGRCLNEAEQAANSLIPEKSKGRYLKSTRQSNNRRI
jgi:hypothetical protein